jgi:negative regulator of replication initiation
MGKKRLVVDLDEYDYSVIAEKAGKSGLTLSNYVRKMMDLPLERQGVKRKTIPPRKKKAKKNADAMPAKGE